MMHCDITTSGHFTGDDALWHHYWWTVYWLANDALWHHYWWTFYWLANDALWHHYWLANDALWHHYWLVTLANDVMSLLKKGLNSPTSCWWCWMTQISSISTWFPLKHHKLTLTFHKTKACMLISLLINLLTKSEWNLCGHRKSLPC